MKKEKTSKVCIVDTVYTLLLYYLHCSTADFNSTFFFVSSGLPDYIIKKLPKYHFLKKRNSVISRCIFRIILGLFASLRWSFLRTKPIYALDHLTYSSVLIGNKTYTLLEDGPYAITYYYGGTFYKKNKHLRSFFIVRLMSDLIFGPLFLRPYGENKQCKELILSAECEDLPELSGKIKHVRSLNDLWNNSDKEKKENILHLFNLTPKILSPLFEKSIIIFTQTFYVDGILYEEEQIQLYQNIIKTYPKEEILLKTHPRDTIDYVKHFPNVAVFSEVVPFQLLNLLNIKFKKAVTISSSSVLSFDYDIKIDWLGTTIHPKIQEALGIIDIPKKL